MQKNRLAILRDRAEMLASARSFFSQRGILEVDCPLLSSAASVDAHIDLITALPFSGTRYMHSSPEYGMKRLLSEGIGDIFQLSHVFRDEEAGAKHNPEFMMAEWYRVGFSFQEMIHETADFARLFLGHMPMNLLSYREAFRHYAGFDSAEVSEEFLMDYIKEKEVPLYPEVVSEGKDALLNLILALCIEPQLGNEGLCALAYYPATQAALAQTCELEGKLVAERFELYYRGIELANGYHELADPLEQRERLVEANQARRTLGKVSLPLDENFLLALKRGLPECCGVAVGFDRLMMLRHREPHIASVLPFIWELA
jgi:lysyl-tRNA synthetase class 2